MSQDEETVASTRQKPREVQMMAEESAPPQKQMNQISECQMPTSQEPKLSDWMTYDKLVPQVKPGDLVEIERLNLYFKIVCVS